VKPTSESLLKEAKAFHLKKRLGQHFLVSTDALETVVNLLAPTSADTVIEVGPGIGFLTRFLSDTGARIIAVDLDRESIESLRETNLPGVELWHGDFLDFDLSALDFARKPTRPPEETPPIPERLKVVGNVPYQITGLILGHILGEINAPAPWLSKIDGIVLTVQREVAQRMVAKPGTDAYSKVSLLIDYFCESQLEMVIPPEGFYPPPKVTSAIVKMVPRPAPPIDVRNTNLLKQIIDAGFRQRRKMLRNSLSFVGLQQGEIDQIFRQLAFDPQVRAERLGLPQFAMLTDAIDECLKAHAHDPSTSTSKG
jgi:16S rRNA (adenine1518-N6/adenine1519-N6)-dimethyltransferase